MNIGKKVKRIEKPEKTEVSTYPKEKPIPVPNWPNPQPAEVPNGR